MSNECCLNSTPARLRFRGKAEVGWEEEEFRTPDYLVFAAAVIYSCRVSVRAVAGAEGGQSYNSRVPDILVVKDKDQR